jgi:hypothetical protein
MPMLSTERVHKILTLNELLLELLCCPAFNPRNSRSQFVDTIS